MFYDHLQLVLIAWFYFILLLLFSRYCPHFLLYFRSGPCPWALLYQDWSKSFSFITVSTPARLIKSLLYDIRWGFCIFNATRYDPRLLLHGQQYIEIYKPLPSCGRVRLLSDHKPSRMFIIEFALLFLSQSIWIASPSGKDFVPLGWSWFQTRLRGFVSRIIVLIVLTTNCFL